MELRIRDYVIRPDNGNTWSLSRIITTTKGENIGTTYETSPIFPKDITTCILRIREDMRRDDTSYADTLEQFATELKSIDNELIGYIEKAVLTFNN